MKTRRLSAALLVTAALALCVYAAPATAQEQKYKGASSGLGDPTLITVSGQILFRIRAGAGGYTATQRAEAVQDRLVPILSLERLTSSDITVKQARPNQDASIYVRDKLLVTVDRTLAQANGDKDPGALARTWADRVRTILPSVSVKPNQNGL